MVESEGNNNNEASIMSFDDKMPTRIAANPRGAGLKGYLQKQFATLQRRRKPKPQQCSLDYTTTEVYAATAPSYRSLHAFRCR